MLMLISSYKGCLEKIWDKGFFPFSVVNLLIVSVVWHKRSVWEPRRCFVRISASDSEFGSLGDLGVNLGGLAAVGR